MVKPNGLAQHLDELEQCKTQLPLDAHQHFIVFDHTNNDLPIDISMIVADAKRAAIPRYRTSVFLRAEPFEIHSA